MVTVKICGLLGPEDAAAVAAAGADFAGLNFVPWSKRRIDPGAARAILAALGKVEPVGVFADQDPKTVESIASDLGLAWIQLHGAEPPEACAHLARRFAVIKAFRVDATFDPQATATYAPAARFFLLDAPQPGSGRAFDWSALRGRELSRPYFLAGGLTPENVAEAIGTARPDGVDTASGVEIGGRKDARRILAFVEATRRTGHNRRLP